MLSKLASIKNSQQPVDELLELLNLLHKEGPVGSDLLESIALYSEFHPQEFSKLEEHFISALGLFYKVPAPSNLYSLLLATIGNNHKAEYGSFLTPVQASVRRAVDKFQFVSISAPTSAGKSYSIRDFICEQSGDAVVIVPSRALIAEYISAIKRHFNEQKNVMISSFVDKVFLSRELRRIFVLTPERARELFLMRDQLAIGVFFFDEAQVSEEKGRGIIFDVLVRRVQRSFPDARLIFAHPFTENPDAQFKKHNIDSERAYAHSYSQGAVGKICIYRHKNDKDYYFTSTDEKGYLLKKCIEFGGGFNQFAFNGNHSILIFVSKASIYSGKFLESFEEYIDRFEYVTDVKALEIIAAVEHILGADENEHRSKLVSLLRKGVVIHHGSVPLDVRFLLEDFIRSGFAKVCFATSTLAQGVNMPFDIVWLESNRIIGRDEQERALAFKNLVGRAGRLSAERKFDYGYVFTDNPQLYIRRVNEPFALSEVSVIDQDFETDAWETKELRESIRQGSFDDDLNVPIPRAQRLSDQKIQDACKAILDLLYAGGSIRENISGEVNKAVRETIREKLRLIFVTSVNRELYKGESSVFNTAVMIFMLAIGGRTFREIAGIRYSEISKRDTGHIGEATFSQCAEQIPNSSLVSAFPLFKNTAAKDVSYDSVVFDTYDYMDQVIAFSLSDVFSAAFKIYRKQTDDSRAEKMLELLRFGTNNVVHVLLMRYGFSPETISEITPYIQFVNEDQIIFSDNIYSAPQQVRNMVEWYLP
ncbi:DEAD/DEAH box helicase [Janthinobacterium sp. 17J80-10]|uniref:DEAD/DEAH box helicase n=1 Tax=Janthinobacterium sp. 17J80-10 TaxID=2497863 RepID=UPI00100596B9|nr:DEAD/DEAH box helicase [Janthinobacterium sp. 17J80-10]QAU33755.1 helicase [Janthinobacterium sp. 17J80-10]